MTTALATSPSTVDQQPISVPKRSRSQPGRIEGKLKTAINDMVDNGTPWQQAAENAGLHMRNMRLALEKPHVIKYLRAAKQVSRERVSAANIFKLAEIRDQAENKMASLGAIKLLEQIEDEQAKSIGSQRSPGLQVVILMQQPAASPIGQMPIIDAKPLINNEDVPDDE